MDKQKFLTTTVSFLESNLLPGLRDSYGSWVEFALGGLLATSSHKMWDKFEPMMKDFGFVNEYGEVDIAALEAFINGGFSKVPELRFSPRELLGFKFDNPLINKIIDGNMVFTKAEADEYLNLLKSV